MGCGAIGAAKGVLAAECGVAVRSIEYWFWARNKRLRAAGIDPASVEAAGKPYANSAGETITEDCAKRAISKESTHRLELIEKVEKEEQQPRAYRPSAPLTDGEVSLTAANTPRSLFDVLSSSDDGESDGIVSCGYKTGILSIPAHEDVSALLENCDRSSTKAKSCTSWEVEAEDRQDPSFEQSASAANAQHLQSANDWSWNDTTNLGPAKVGSMPMVR